MRGIISPEIRIDMQLNEIQNSIAKEEAEAWVLVDYENRNPVVAKLLDHKMLTRKIIVIIPCNGKSQIICHAIDEVFLKGDATKACFDLNVYKTWQQMLELETKLIKPYKRVLMDYSPNGLLMRVGLADYGSVDFVKNLGVEVASSMNVLQSLTALISPKGRELQQKACKIALQIKDEAFAKIAKDVLEQGQSDEYEIQQFICDRFHEEGMIYDDPAIVAIGPNASDPHYGPSKETHSPIKKGDLVLIDMWAKFDLEEAVYADITWMGYVGETVPEIYKKRFEIVKAARDGVIAFLKEQLPLRSVKAYEADDVARRIITEAGYGDYFLHRVGHNIADDVSPHGPGANLDDYETKDERALLSCTSFSDEPGIYAPDFGIRTETDLYNNNGCLEVVAGLQEEILPLLAK